MNEISFVTAFLAGVATFFVPCIIPVLPGFFAFLGGESTQKNSRGKLFLSTLIFTLGFTLIFVLLGVGANFFGKPLSAERVLFEKVGGALLILFGIFLTGTVKLPPLFSISGQKLQFLQSSSFVLRSFLFGTIFGFAWTPCIGPILASILFFATGEETAQAGGLLLFIFSVGLSTPFLASSLFVPELKKVLGKISFLAHYAQWIFGIILVIIGFLLFFGKLGAYSALLIERFGTGLVF